MRARAGAGAGAGVVAGMDRGKAKDEQRQRADDRAGRRPIDKAGLLCVAEELDEVRKHRSRRVVGTLVAVEGGGRQSSAQAPHQSRPSRGSRSSHDTISGEGGAGPNHHPPSPGGYYVVASSLLSLLCFRGGCTLVSCAFSHFSHFSHFSRSSRSSCCSRSSWIITNAATRVQKPQPAECLSSSQSSQAQHAR